MVNPPNQHIVTTTNLISKMKERPVYPFEPLGLALAIGRVDPDTGLPGIPLGKIMEFSGRAGTCKSATADQVVLGVQKKDPEAICLGLFFEEFDDDRFQSLNLDTDRYWAMDWFSNDKNMTLRSAEMGLKTMIQIIKDEPKVKCCVIDSLGAMAVSKEMYTDKGEEKEFDAYIQYGARAKVTTEFINHYMRIPVTRRPILIMINHSKDKIDANAGGPPKNVIIDESSKRKTPCGTGKDFRTDVRLECHSRKHYLDDGKTLNNQGLKIQDGWEVIHEVFRNRGTCEDADRRPQSIFLLDEHRFDVEEEIIKYAKGLNLIYSTGNWIEIEGTKYNGVVKAKEALRNFPELKLSLIKKLAPLAHKIFGETKKVSNDI